MLNMAVRELVPSPVVSAWELSYPDKGENAMPLHPGYSITDALSKLNLSNVELSGALGGAWITVEEGSALCAPCRGHQMFSWHYHPDGECRFSVDDWISFLISDAWVTLLLTTERASLYTKRGNGRWREIRRCINGSDTHLIPRPNLQWVRFMRLMQKEMKAHDWPSLPEEQISSTLGITCERATFK